jgi:hypothetical protein
MNILAKIFLDQGGEDPTEQTALELHHVRCLVTKLNNQPHVAATEIPFDHIPA